jgi:hypothetical protein
MTTVAAIRSLILNVDSREVTPANIMLSSAVVTTLSVSFAALGLAVFVYLSTTLNSYPLFPFQMDNLDWTGAWLLMTVADYYGSTFCFSAIVACSEPPLYATLWILAFNLLGSPFCCSYIVYR